MFHTPNPSHGYAEEILLCAIFHSLHFEALKYTFPNIPLFEALHSLSDGLSSYYHKLA